MLLGHVLAALPDELSQAVATAGLEDGRLTLGVAGAVWASRIRYMTDALQAKVAASSGSSIQSVRIKVVQRAG